MDVRSRIKRTEEKLKEMNREVGTLREERFHYMINYKLLVNPRSGWTYTTLMEKKRALRDQEDRLNCSILDILSDSL